MRQGLRILPLFEPALFNFGRQIHEDGTGNGGVTGRQANLGDLDLAVEPRPAATLLRHFAGEHAERLLLAAGAGRFQGEIEAVRRGILRLRAILIRAERASRGLRPI